MSLVVTVAFSSVAGWLFLVFTVGWLGSSVARGVLLRRWGGRQRGDTSPLRASTSLRAVRLVAFIVGGIAGALIATRLAKPAYVVYPGFVAGGTLASLLTTWLAVLRFPMAHTPERSASAPEARFDLELGLVASTLLQVTGDEHERANLVARSLTTSYDAGRRAALDADPRLATRITLKREHLPGAPADVERAWTSVIDAARRGIADAQMERASGE